MVTVQERVTIPETDFKALEMRLTIQLGGLMIAGFGIVIAVLKLWQ